MAHHSLEVREQLEVNVLVALWNHAVWKMKGQFFKAWRTSMSACPWLQ